MTQQADKKMGSPSTTAKSGSEGAAKTAMNLTASGLLTADQLAGIPEAEWKIDFFLNKKDDPEVLYVDFEKCGEGYFFFNTNFREPIFRVSDFLSCYPEKFSKSF
jgi:hypothetical protein